MTADVTTQPAAVQPPPVSGDLAVATRGLVKSYGKHKALVGLDMSVPRGKVYGFLGPNGSGKTTALRLLTGLLRPNAGTIALFGTPYTWHDRKRLFRVGSLIETPSFYPYLSGHENLLVLSASGPPTDPARIPQVLEYVGMGNRSKDAVQTYSLGMKQRLGIAAAMLSDPDLLLLDEPANGLDPGGMVAMRETLRYFTETLGKTVVISSHLLHEVEQLADVVGIIDRGRLLREGELQQLLADAGRVKVRVALHEMAQAAEILRRMAPDRPLYGVDTGEQAGWFTVGISPDRSAEINRELVAAGIYASGLEPGSDLESVFLELTGTGANVHDRPDQVGQMGGLLPSSPAAPPSGPPAAPAGPQEPGS